MPHQASKYSKYFYTNKNYNILSHNNQRNIVKTKVSKNNSIKRNLKKVVANILLLTIITIFVGVLLMFLFQSNLFKIKNLVIENIENQESYSQISKILDEQKNKKFLIWEQDNFFLFNTEDFIDLIELRSNSYFYDIKIDKKFPNKIKVELKERSPKILIVTKKGQSFFDENANMSALSAQIDNTFPILYIDEDIDPKNEIIKKENILFILNVYKKLPKYGLNISKIKIEITDDNKLIIEESRGFTIYFNMIKDVDEQINYLNVVIKEEIKEKLSQIQYIDLRFIPKVFYK